MKLSAVVLTRNEEKNIERCLNSLTFCNEILVIDNFSTDKTRELAKKRKAKVFLKKMTNNFSNLRNFGFSKSRGEWTLFVDADEVVSKDLAKEILKIINSTEKMTYYIKRRDYFWGRELFFGEVKEVRNNGLIRLVRRSSGKWQSPVHETFITNYPTGRLNSYLNHYPHQSLREFLIDINFYSTLRAMELFKHKEIVSWPKIVFYPVGKFLANYILKLGFLDGAPGFVYAFLMSFHSFLVRAKVYQYQKLA